jgi:hypothetical protein
VGIVVVAIAIADGAEPGIEEADRRQIAGGDVGQEIRERGRYLFLSLNSRSNRKSPWAF